jgi:hypothetical protein
MVFVAGCVYSVFCSATYFSHLSFNNVIVPLTIVQVLTQINSIFHYMHFKSNLTMSNVSTGIGGKVRSSPWNIKPTRYMSSKVEELQFHAPALFQPMHWYENPISRNWMTRSGGRGQFIRDSLTNQYACFFELSYFQQSANPGPVSPGNRQKVGVSL